MLQKIPFYVTIRRNQLSSQLSFKSSKLFQLKKNIFNEKTVLRTILKKENKTFNSQQKLHLFRIKNP